MKKEMNPIMCLDFPDPDVIRVEDTYYMVSTTMHFMPGGQILRSYDLVNWEHVTYIYDTLDGTEGQKLTGDSNIYGQGMWAATLRYHKGIFYICFAANDTGKTYLFTGEDIHGPWKKQYIEGFYHDSSLLFDDDGCVYIAYGNKDIWLTQLNTDLSGPLEGGLHRVIVSDEGHPGLGYEGTHIYKINGRYYTFFIHSRRDRWMRVEACFSADSLEGEFTGGDILEDDRGYCGQGVAQGGIVDTPEGDWYAVLFQDHGAVGRIPILIPMCFQDNFPVIGEQGNIPKTFPVKSTRTEYQYQPLVGSDDFKNGIDSKWQFNHEPNPLCYEVDREKGYYGITTSKLCNHVTQAVNTLTQRMKFPSCAAEITIDAKEMKEGDYAGICALQGCYGMVAVTKRNGELAIVMKGREKEGDMYSEREWESVVCLNKVVTLRVEVDFQDMKDEAVFYYQDKDGFKQIGKRHKLYFLLDHFTGCRFGLFLYATKEIGGKAYFSSFRYDNDSEGFC